MCCCHSSTYKKAFIASLTIHLANEFRIVSLCWQNTIPFANQSVLKHLHPR